MAAGISRFEETYLPAPRAIIASGADARLENRASHCLSGQHDHWILEVLDNGLQQFRA